VAWFVVVNAPFWRFFIANSRNRIAPICLINIPWWIKAGDQPGVLVFMAWLSVPQKWRDRHDRSEQQRHVKQ
jgi:hypothetical protein